MYKNNNNNKSHTKTIAVAHLLVYLYDLYHVINKIKT